MNFFVFGGLPGFILPSVTSGFRDTLTFLYVFSIKKRARIVQSWAVQICTWNTIHILKSSCLSPPSYDSHTSTSTRHRFPSVSPEHKQYKGPLIRVEAMPKIKTYVTSPPAEKAPPLLSVRALWVVLAQHHWGTQQCNNNEGGFG